MLRPTELECLRPLGVLAIRAGYSHSGALVAGGQLYLWGGGELGQQGNGASAPMCWCRASCSILSTIES